ncbi:MAG: hypothetical protein GX066_02875 [Clostridiaceae bacterium]|nr:hypothetical protein [Clostridiaceae bacterium]
MNDKLEMKLLEARKDADRFFSNFPYEKMNNAVFAKLSKDRDVVYHKRHFIYPLVIKISALSACLIFLISAVSFFRDGLDYEKENMASLGKPVSQQMIKPDNKEGLYQWLNFFNINKPNQVENNLLAVIWKPGSSGDYEMAYSSLFENSNKPCPAYMIVFPDNQPSVVIISSQNDDKKYIHYRVLGYKEDKIIAYMEQNYVIGGKIEVVDGALKETRLIPDNYVEKEDIEKENNGNMKKIITYYIPYQTNESGDIIPSVENIRIRKGDYIAIIGDNTVPVEILNSRMLLDWDKQYDNIKSLYAKSSGYEDLCLRPLNGGETKKISVEVVEDEL